MSVGSSLTRAATCCAFKDDLAPGGWPYPPMTMKSLRCVGQHGVRYVSAPADEPLEDKLETVASQMTSHVQRSASHRF
jgi:hypothetical protein